MLQVTFTDLPCFLKRVCVFAFNNILHYFNIGKHSAQIFMSLEKYIYVMKYHLFSSYLLIQAKLSLNMNVRTSLDKYSQISGSDHNMALKPGLKAGAKGMCFFFFALASLGHWPPPDLQSQTNPDLNPSPEPVYQSDKRPRFIEIHVFI